jgi:acetylornithine/succinyldiaminopimelate/putrescine aminotransferase
MDARTPAALGGTFGGNRLECGQAGQTTRAVTANLFAATRDEANGTFQAKYCEATS